MGKKCESCFYWSDFLAKAEHGVTLAMCLNDESSCQGKYVSGRNTCDHHKETEDGSRADSGI